ncbi:MAG: T9SS type A sorting domain-containing protein, partial [Bacteroidia bacterium]|nr:T9SS type A sorting domain-containing protein [Bacteroidia bacterium]
NGVTIKPYSGITLIQTKTPANTNQYVIIGDNNIFDKLHYGIIATRSKLWVRKNSFFNMDGRGDVGVLIAGAATGLQNVVNPSDVKIGGTVAEANDFNTCYNGVISNYATALTVRNNNFIFSNTAIAVNANNRNKTATVDRNKINATQLGIQFYNNISLNSQITENTLINTIPVGIYNSNTGINVSEVVTTSYTKYNLYNNNINGYFNGIYVTNTYSTQITDNEVHLTPDNTPYHFQFGIRIENTNLAFLYNNNVDKPSADNNAWWQYGIFANTNITPRLLCNGVNNMYASLKFQGPNITTAGFGIIGNDMNNGKIGIWLDAQAEIGNQYLSIFGNYASDNKWHGFSPTNPQTFSSSGSNALNATMDTKGIMPTGNVYYLDPANATGVLTGSSHYLLRNPFSFPSQNLNCNSGIATPLLRMQNANNIASNTIGFAGNAANMYAISKRHLFHNIKLNNINVSTDPIIKAFMDSANATHIGKFYQVDSMMLKAIATGSTSLLNTARNLNNSIANTGNIVYNKQTLNTTYMNMLNAEPDSATLADLRTLAIKCPNLEGDAVFQARGILMYYDRVTYTSICDNTVPLFGTNHRLGNTDNALAPQEPKELIVYPNPTNRDITIEYTKGDDNEAAELVVFNQLGELVLTKTLSDNKTTLSLEFLNSGIYFYTIRQQGMVLKTSKLVITK